jgi:hypothetical protein
MGFPAAAAPTAIPVKLTAMSVTGTNVYGPGRVITRSEYRLIRAPVKSGK